MCSKSIHIFIIMMFALSVSEFSYGKAKKSSHKSAKKSVKAEQVPAMEPPAPRQERETSVDLELKSEIQKYRKGQISAKTLWMTIGRISSKADRLSDSGIILFTQIKSELILKAGYPVIAATYAADSLKISSNPFDKRNHNTWTRLHAISEQRPIQYILEDLAQNIKAPGLPYSFENDWNYIIGNSHASAGENSKALTYYRKVDVGNRYYMPANYQIAMVSIEEKKFEDAETALKTIIYPETFKISPLSQKDKEELYNYSNIALGRLLYQNGKFLDSARYYRKVKHNSSLFYDALFEQSWALFMSGNPKHALGSLYGASSPYFANKFNPEAKILESIIYFWMCRYDDSRNSLADFTEKYSKSVESLEAFLKRNRFDTERAYQLFEDLVSGVTSESLGIPRNVLSTAAEKDTMLLVRDQLATVLGEQESIEYNGIFGDKSNIKDPIERIDIIKRTLKTELGKQFIKELKNLKDHYDELYSQAKFLYLELIMSEKEQLLGGELHSATKVSKVSDRNQIYGWGNTETQGWSKVKGEFWWDEVGYHIVDIKPECNVE
ncbi:MAG: hypothetical protein HQK54_02695 [Oligoflexales bacterium]|nr:hypothetical protein [Oligoflexales bacterium]